MKKSALKKDEIDGQAFDAFFREHRQLVYRAAYSVTHSAEDAEDVLQTIFLHLMHCGDPTRLARNIKGYLYRAAVKEALMLQRTRGRQAIPVNLGYGEEPLASGRSVLEDAMHEELAEAMGQLKPEDVEMLNLRYEQGYSDWEIARMLGRSRITIAVDLYRARARLKTLMRAAPSPNEQAPGAQMSIEGGRS